ncbi:Hint domain-containing protein [Sedimentitalea sp. JM2-8]|uniref:Hint domain-containing protein n=1 Tax=Sedimentitalea xiamensis TaxID=3050037 RepID=A0ABT7FH35_9RHOB|nr:Hint domain-containing protein [Sedimentitalea xiamensis]MDK3074300.1 Hint domain-containing protein [Sedimentitalea xiamensis]
MADWDYTAYLVYGTDGTIDGSSNVISGTLTDSDAGNDLFDTTETITGGQDGFGATDDDGTFVGTVDVLGVTWVGVEANSGKTIFYATVNPGTTSSEIADGFRAFAGNSNSINDLPLSNATGFTTCFAIGTLIATPKGERAVEDLKIGDLILTADGHTVPVKWIGRQTLHKIFTPAERFTPVRVARGALRDGLPHTDLVLTAEHALILDGLAINAGALVNGTTITFDPLDSLPDRVTYYHIETEDHSVILANGAAAETYVDYIGRRVFDNHAEYLDLYGEERAITEMSLPRVSAARLVPPAIRARLDRQNAA